jgi:SAM-dependent methyltransferase
MSVPDLRLDYPATGRNRAPIFAVLQRVLPDGGGTLLELASGSGQHGAWMVAQLPGWHWQPTDVQPEALDSIASWRRHAGVERLLPPVRLDVRAESWPVERVQAVFCANMIHIAPWSCAEGLFAGVGRVLDPGGVLVLYGPFKVGGVHTAPSNAAFDASLRARDPSWGVRDREAVEQLAGTVGLRLVEQVDMPANNQILVFQRGG